MHARRFIGIVLILLSFFCGAAFTGLIALDSSPDESGIAGFVFFSIGLLLVSGSIEDKVSKIEKLKMELEQRRKDVEYEITSGTFRTDPWIHYEHTVERLKSLGYDVKGEEEWALKRARFAAGRLYAKTARSIKSGRMVMTSSGRDAKTRNHDALSLLAELGDLDNLNYRKLKRLYMEKNKPYDITQLEGSMVLHALPHPDSRHRSQTQINNKALSWDDAQAYTQHDFLRLILDKRPMLACYLHDIRSKELASYDNGIGIIIGKGGIFDASQKDMQSQGMPDGARLRHTMASPGEQNMELAERVRRAAYSTRTSQLHEVIVGDYAVTGIYFDAKNRGFRIDELAGVAKIANDRGIPLFRFDKGEGFSRVDPKDYLRKDYIPPSPS
jgi:hypothetical protein